MKVYLDRKYQDKTIVFFDGSCGLCNRSVDFLISMDKRRTLRYASLQSLLGQQLLKEMDLATDKYDSFVLFRKGDVFQESTAALMVLKFLGGFWKLSTLFFIVPKFLRDWVYKTISQKRYRFFGKNESCRLPNEEEKRLFLM